MNAVAEKGKPKSRSGKVLEKLKQVNEMARLANFSAKSGQFELWVYHEPLMNPSFHLVNKTKGYEVVLTIKQLKELEWKENPRHLKTIPTPDKKDLIAFFSKPHDFDSRQTNWEAWRFAWLLLNPSSTKVPTSMPAYEGSQP